jgi:ribosomal protein L40E
MFLQFFTSGVVVDFHASDPYSIFVGWAIFGVISLVAGAILVYKTYQVFIPLKENGPMPKMVCPRCGAILADEAGVCEKCKQQITNLLRIFSWLF